MEMSGIKRVAVIGGGTMGNGITHVFAMSGFDVNLVETKQEYADRALETIEKNLARMVKKEKISEDDKSATLGRITSSLSIAESVAEADLIVEAIPEVFELKKKVFAEVDQHAPN